MKLGLKIEDAVKLNPKLKKYTYYKNGKMRIDFRDKDALYLYNKTLLKHVFNIDMDFHRDALIPTPVSRYLFIKNLFESFKEKNSRDGKEVLEIGTGSAILAIMAAKYYRCKVYATEVVKEYIEIARENLRRNNLEDKVEIVDSRGRVIEGIEEIESKKFDIILSYPPFYSLHSVPSKRGFGGAYARDVELIGGGKYGEEFSLRILREGIKYLREGGVIGLMMPHKPRERREIIEEEIVNLGLTLERDKIDVGKRTRYIIKGYLL
ncbi:MAG TPA: DUF890 domain-containing protein [Methanothermococcus okinawensis]|uniref:DUF890 domain-containing protein n=1 Tax=Methanothermococcus okinawensis TaxID=155863 RepID=A0A832ZH79_9EURY|nr:DUF890 domain-containing protein [Methanococcaceae archaeon]HIP84908.1 DUF890 domain-containing protein [Methanothermococcus okinawensis]HIP91155.1 DUF890 domain-containing protein [Methanothermococcus okinawensis]